MTTIYLIRHGSNDWVGKAIAGWTPAVHLNADGQRQAEALAVALSGVRFDQVYSSPLERAQETAAPLAERQHLQIRTTEAIGELHFGDWTGRALDDLASDARWQRWNDFRSQARIPNGETMVEVQARAIRFIEQLTVEAPAQTVALFSHGDTIRTVLLYYLGMPFDFFNRIEVSPASVSILLLGQAAPRFYCINWEPVRVATVTT